ncbi:kelch repeat-containing protein, partial [Salmonella sp. s51228]|uniref:kelch repeat-containing protein n=1 Tax=Salmonella sp. s51228 TaxID=3159652 RepID=UPI0039810CD4
MENIGESPTSRLGGFGYYENATEKYLITFGGRNTGGLLDQTYYGLLSGTHPNVTINWTARTYTDKPLPRWGIFSGVCQSEDIFVIVGGSKSKYVNYIDVWYLDLRTDIWVEVNMTGTRPLERYAGGSGFF